MTVTVRYWAAAAAATGVDAETRAPGALRTILAEARSAHPDLERVLSVATILVDGVPAREADEIPAGATVEVLPPFAGG